MVHVLSRGLQWRGLGNGHQTGDTNGVLWYIACVQQPRQQVGCTCTRTLSGLHGRTTPCSQSPPAAAKLLVTHHHQACGWLTTLLTAAFCPFCLVPNHLIKQQVEMHRVTSRAARSAGTQTVPSCTQEQQQPAQRGTPQSLRERPQRELMWRAAQQVSTGGCQMHDAGAVSTHGCCSTASWLAYGLCDSRRQVAACTQPRMVQVLVYWQTCSHLSGLGHCRSTFWAQPHRRLV